MWQCHAETQIVPIFESKISVIKIVSLKHWIVQNYGRLRGDKLSLDVSLTMLSASPESF